MLSNTFCHLPGVGEKTEQRLWARGVHCWGDALLDRQLPHAWRPHLEESLRQLTARNPVPFAEQLPANQAWRLYRDFADSCAFVDIETTGMGPGANITVVGLYDGRSTRTYVWGQNLDQFAHDIADFKLMVTYNGKTFDAPILEQRLGVRLPRAHIDLRYVLRGLGLTGGLKGVERQLGLQRPGVEEVDGFLAVLLWREYRRGIPGALETLLAYNIHDVQNLHWLIVHAHNEYLKRTPFGPRHILPPPTLPAVPFQADAGILARLTPQRLGTWR